MKNKTKKMTTVAMLCAFAYAVMLIGRIPVVLFLKYDPKDVIIAIGGFLYGPLTAFVISALVSLVEMFTTSETGIIGCIMNVISTCAFTCTAAAIYKKQHNMKGAVAGLGCGILTMTAIMLLWNYLITPIYMGIDRAAVTELLLPAFLPFNLLKGMLNLSIILLLYKPVVTALRKSGLVDISQSKTQKKNNKIGVLLVSTLLLATCIFIILVWTKVL